MWHIILGLTLLLKFSTAVFVIEVNKLFKECPSISTPFPWNVSDLQIFLSDDDELLLNGNLVVMNDIYPPVGVNIYSQKQEKGGWIPTPYGKRVLNLCGLMLVKHEIWYSVTRHMNNTRCPLYAGHVESFNMVPLGTFGFDDVLSELVGEWRVFVEITTGVPPKMACIMNEVSVLEH